MTRRFPFPLPSRLFARRPRVNIVRLQGMIAADGRGRLSDAAIAPLLERAFRQGKPTAVALIVNSPGGSPVQSSLIGARIRRLSDETDVPVHAFVEDAAASGGYWIACAADDIWCDPASILGSIGVISSGFGAPELLAKIGLERRVHTAGRSKSQLDPFRPENPEDIARLNDLLTQMHGVFIDHVKAMRGHRLGPDADVFDGRFWIGAEAVRLGLADGIAHATPWLKDRYGDKTRFRTFGPRRRLIPRIGLALAADAMASIDEAALWARLGVR
ncbi:MAG: S49 family peptidase [Paracoccaceae bacterium]